MDPDMEYVYAVYREGGISKAAEKLYMTQPALSIAIRRVEAKLDATLFDRSQHPLKLTNVGEVYVQKYHEIRLLEKELVSRISDMHELNRGELSIGGTHFILSYVLAPVLSKFSNQYPNVEIRLHECSSSQLESLLLNGTIDICLKCDECSTSLQPIDDAFQDRLLMAVPESYVSRYGLPNNSLSLDSIRSDRYIEDKKSVVDLKSLADLPFLILTPGNNLHDRFFELFQQNSVVPKVKMQIEQIVTAYCLADSGMGATLTSSVIVKNSVCRNLVYYKIDSPSMTRNFKVIGRRKQYISHANARFIAMLKSYYSGDP